jgi:hypothetical protein
VYLLYLDDSGSIPDASQQHFVLAGLSVFERQGYWIAQKLDQIAARFNPADAASVELHGSPMLNGSKIWRKIPLPERIDAIKEALRVFAASHASNRAFGVAVDKASVSPRDPVEYCFEQICSRFDRYLMRLHRASDSQRGIIIFDKSAAETSIQRLSREFTTFGHQWGVVRNLAEVPMFIDSRASRLVQLADLIAYAMFRHYERGDSQFYDIFKHRFDAEGGIVHGHHYYRSEPWQVMAQPIPDA